VLVLVYAYGGFEAVLLATGEMRDPRRGHPRGPDDRHRQRRGDLHASANSRCGTLPDPTSTQRPIADSAGQILGHGAAAAIAAGALLSIYGYLSANMLHTPRLTFALAERGDFPQIFARIHKPISHPARLHRVVHGPSVGLHPRRKLPLEHHTFSQSCVCSPIAPSRSPFWFCEDETPRADAFRLPAGKLLAIAAILFCIVLLARAPLSNSTVVLVTSALAALNWALAMERADTSCSILPVVQRRLYMLDSSPRYMGHRPYGG